MVVEIIHSVVTRLFFLVVSARPVVTPGAALFFWSPSRLFLDVIACPAVLATGWHGLRSVLRGVRHNGERKILAHPMECPCAG